MSLPKLTVPTYELNLISNDKTIQYRPFLVREEKLLLMALESKDKKEIIKNIYTVLTNCVLSKGININEMASFDVEYIFLKIREKSMGETIEVLVQCPETKKTFESILNLSDVQIEKSEKLSNKIEITDNLGLILKYPSFMMMQEHGDLKQSDKIFNMIINCIDKIYDKDTIYEAKDYTKKELEEFLENLPQNAFTKINEFFKNFPKIMYEKDVVSPYTNKTVKVRLDSFIDFFG